MSWNLPRFAYNKSRVVQRKGVKLRVIFLCFPPLASEGNAPWRIIYNKLAFENFGKSLAYWLDKLLPYLLAGRAQSGSSLFSSRLVGSLVSDNTENKESQKKGSQLDLSKGGRGGGGEPQVLLCLQTIFCPSSCRQPHGQHFAAGIVASCESWASFLSVGKQQCELALRAL